MITCPSCGYDNPLGASFCSSCGAPLNERQPTDGDVTASFEPSMLEEEIVEALSLVEMPEGTRGMLVVHQGPKKGTRIALDQEEVSIGRDPESDIFLDDITVSRTHAKLQLTDEGFIVADDGSMNGTYVNKKSVDQVLLVNADELQIGKFKLVYLALPE